MYTVYSLYTLYSLYSLDGVHGVEQGGSMKLLLAALAMLLAGCPLAPQRSGGPPPGTIIGSQLPLGRFDATNVGKEGFRFDLPAPGSLALSVDPAPAEIRVYVEGERDPRGSPSAGPRLEAAHLPKGTVYVIVLPRGEFRLEARFTPATVSIAPDTVVNDPALTELGAELRAALAAAFAAEGFRVVPGGGSYVASTSIDYTPWTAVTGTSSLYVEVKLSCGDEWVDQVDVQRLNEGFPENNELPAFARELVHQLAISKRLATFLQPMPAGPPSAPPRGRPR